MVRSLLFILVVATHLLRCGGEDQAVEGPVEPYTYRSGPAMDAATTPVPITVTETAPGSARPPRTTPVSGTPSVEAVPQMVYPAGRPDVVPVSDAPRVIELGRNGVPEPNTYVIDGSVRTALQTRPVAVPALALTKTAVGSFQFLDASSVMNGGRIYAMLEDSHGNIWFGQDGGISKYDGNSLTNYGREHGLGVTWVRSLCEDRSGNIWIGGDPGVSVFNGRTFTNYSLGDSLGDDVVLAMLADRSGAIWVGTRSGAKRLVPDSLSTTATVTRFTVREGLSDNNIKSLMEDHRGNLWLGTLNGGATRFTPPRKGSGGQFTHFTMRQGLISNNVPSIYEDGSGAIWFGSGGSGPSFDMNYSGMGAGGVSRYQPGADGDSITRYTAAEGLPGSVVTTIGEDRSGNFWFGTADAGAVKLTVQTDGSGTFTHYSARTGLSNDDVSSFLEDDHGNLWFGSGSNGVVKYTPGLHYFTQENGFITNNVYAVRSDSSGNLWIGTLGNGVIRYDQHKFTYYTKENGLAGNSVFAIEAGPDGEVWFATDDGLSRFSPIPGSDRGRFTNYTTEHGLQDNALFSLYRDQEGDLWIGGIGAGITRMDLSAGRNDTRFTHYVPQSPAGSRGPTASGYRVWITAIQGDDLGNIWFNVRHTGLFSINPRHHGNTFTHLHQAGTAGSDEHRLFDLVPADSGQLWIATLQGLHLYDGRSFIPFPLGTALGPPLSIVPDRRGNIWLGRHQGLGLLIPGKGEDDSTLPGWPRGESDYQLIPYAKADGLLELNFWRGAHLDRRDQLWFGTGTSLTMLDLREFAHPRGSPQLRLHSVDINQQFIDYNRLGDTAYQATLPFGTRLARAFTSVPDFSNYPENLRLPIRLNHLTFRFSAIDWSAPHKVQYSYLMDGLDEAWSIPSPDHTAEYRNLPHGTFTLLVRAIGEGSTWSEPMAYTFTILPPWWHTWWARAAFAAALVFLVFRIIRWRTGLHKRRLRIRERELAQERKLTERLQGVDKLKDQFLANTSHELRTPLHGIIGLSESLYEQAENDSPEKQRETLEMIISSAKRLNYLVNDILDFSKLKNHDIELIRKPVNLRILTDIVFRNNAPLIRDKKLEMVNAIPRDLVNAQADENRLQQVLYNLIGNAIKFTERGQIRVSARKRGDDLIEVGVEDTGPGIPENKRTLIFQEFEQGDGSTGREFAGTGLGLSISKRLVELHGGDMWLVSEMGRGSTFYFTLPASHIVEDVRDTPDRSEVTERILVTSRPGIAPAPAAALNGSTIRILVVDDEPVNQQVLSNHLRQQGYQLTQAMNGEEAILAIETEEAFDLVLLDVMMPRMSGYEVCQKIREKYLTSELPIIMVTAKNQMQDIVHGLTVGANDYLPKPFHKPELLARINTQLDLHRIFKVAAKFVPNAFLQSLNKERLTEVSLGDHIEREVTVLFTDIRDYTALAEMMTPEENFMFINAYNGRVGPIVQKHHGFVNQYLGDGIMAIFPGNPRDALLAAVEMQLILHRHNSQRQRDSLPPLRIGAGLHSGPLIMGITGDSDRMDAATIADAVNTASRIESLTKYYGVTILLTESSVEEMEHRDDHQLRYLGKVVVKGKKEPIGLYECYDGDIPEIVYKKAATQGTFETGLDEFYRRNFVSAIRNFEEVLAINPDDQPAQMFLERARTLKTRGVPEAWTGIEVMTFK